MKRIVYSACKSVFAGLAVMLAGTFICCSERHRANDSEGTPIVPTIQQPMHVNFFIENSGSMVGYCNVKDSSALETLVDDYYERVRSSADTGDTITLNFINTEIETFASDKTKYLNSIKSKCTAPYTKIDDMLSMMMETIDGTDVNILISDYVFDSDNGNFQMASSKITSLFSRQLKEKNQMGIAIFKYMRSFNGRYYPGGIPCRKPLPVYVWVFGQYDNVNRIAKLNYNTRNCGQYVLQLPLSPSYELSAKSKRVTEGKVLNVARWKKDRRNDYYEFEATVDLTGALATTDFLMDVANYKISSSTSSDYWLDRISREGDNKYKYTIRTAHPAPGEIRVSCPIISPSWIEESNFMDTKTLPADGTTLGISYLIGGVSKAYNDMSPNGANYFEITIKAQ